MADITLHVTQAVAQIVKLPGSQGASGPQGPQGPQGSNGTTFEYTQGSASATWVIVHNLHRHPSVTVADSTGREMEGDVSYDTVDQITVRFSAAFAGQAYLN